MPFPVKQLVTFMDSAGQAEVAQVQSTVGEARLTESVDALGSVESGVVIHTRVLTVTVSDTSMKLRPTHRLTLPTFDDLDYRITERRQNGSQFTLLVSARERL